MPSFVNGQPVGRENSFADGTPGFPTITADGNSPSVWWPGGDGAFSAIGTFGGATVTLQLRAPDDSTWLAVGSGTTLTAAGVSGFSAPPCYMRVNVASSAGASIKAYTRGIPIAPL